MGILLTQATKRTLADYLSEKVWVPAGMEQQAHWILSKTGKEISGCCMQAASWDFARFGQFILNGAAVNGQSIVPDGWLAQATNTRVSIGQGIFIDLNRKLVIASNANCAGGATDRGASASREAFYRAVQKEVDGEAATVQGPGPARKCRDWLGRLEAQSLRLVPLSDTWESGESTPQVPNPPLAT